MTGRAAALLRVAFAAAALLPPAAACATGGGPRLATDLDAIQDQLWKIQKDNAAMVQQIQELRAGRAPGAEAISAAPDLRLRLETLERDLKVLQARAEESDARFGAVVQDLRATREAVETLLRTTAPGAPAPSGVLPPPPPGTAASPQDPLENLYRQGYADYAKGNYALAASELQQFVERYPASDLADDAQYMLGEVQFSRGDFTGAIAAFDKVIQSYPKGDKVVAAFLKKGLALLELNRTADAVIQLQHVVTTHPASEEARIAREKLRELGLGGR